MQKHNLPRTARIRKRREYQQLFRLGRRFQTAHFYIYALPNTLGYSRLGLTVSRKAGKAVQRNVIKRVVREVFRRNRPNVSLDILVSAKRTAVAVRYGEFEREFLHFLENSRHAKRLHRSHHRL